MEWAPWLKFNSLYYIKIIVFLVKKYAVQKRNKNVLSNIKKTRSKFYSKKKEREKSYVQNTVKMAFVLTIYKIQSEKKTSRKSVH